MSAVGLVGGNQLRLLHCGTDFFPAILEAFDQASAEIHVETYIFEIDSVGQQVIDALSRAAARGVQVYVITDWIGTGRVQSSKLHQILLAAGVHHRTFNPWFRRGLTRTHRKICVVDRRAAFIGGININDDFFSDDDQHVQLPAERWDFAVEIHGPLVETILREAESQWMRLGALKVRSRWQLFKGRKHANASTVDSGARAALVMRGNLRNRRTIQHAIIGALSGAQHSALLATPYFAPGRKLRDAMAKAAARGVDVTLLLGVGQFRMQDAVAHSFYPKLLGNGVRVVEYHRTQLHAKVAVVDEDWSTIGSSNYDGLSLFINQEANLVIEDAVFAATLRSRIESAIAESVVIAPEDFAHVGRLARIGYGAAYFLYSGVMRLATFGKYS